MKLSRCLRPATLIGTLFLSACAIPISGLGGSNTHQSSPQQTSAYLPPSDVATQSQASQPTPTSVIKQHAQTFSGVVPSTTPNKTERITLTLFQEGSFRLRRSVIGDNKTPPKIIAGRWERSGDNKKELTLLNQQNDGGHYYFETETKLRLEDLFGQPLNSSLRYTIAEQVDVDPIEEPLIIKGNVVISSNYAQLSMCDTQLSHEILHRGGFSEIAQRYQELRNKNKQQVQIPMIVEARFVYSDQAPFNKIEIARLLQSGDTVGECQ